MRIVTFYLHKVSGGGGIKVLHPTNSYGHTDTGPWIKVSSKRLEKARIELMTPGLQDE